MSISAADVKALRERTGAGMMDCKKALKEADGDFEKAVEVLRKKGQKVSEKRSDRETNQGVVVTLTNDANTKGLALAMSCETDFVARSDDFVEYANKFAQAAFDNGINKSDALMDIEIDGLKVSKHLETLIGKIGEKIEISDVDFLEGEGSVVKYNHPGDQLGVIVQFDGELKDEDAGRDVAMQIAAMNPLGVTRDEVPSDTVEKELEIAKEQLLSEGKPEEIAEKAAQGKLRRFYEERVLLEQKFVKDGSMNVQKFLDSKDAPTVTAFVRLAVGDNA